MTTTTCIKIEFTADDRSTLIRAYIPENNRHLFQSGQLDADLNEIFIAYLNVNTALASRYREYVIISNQYGEEVNTVKVWLQNESDYILNSLKDWEVFNIKAVDFSNI